MGPATQPYRFEPKHVYNLEASGIIKGTKKQAAAEKLMDWLATPEGQRATTANSPNPGR